MSNTAASVLNLAGSQVGHKGRPNKYTDEYSSRHGSVYESAAWCDMFVTWVARHASAASPLPNGDRAYTPTHASDFRDHAEWYAGTLYNVKNHAQPGDVVFFDWGATDNIDAIDHVGYVLRNNHDGTLDTVEGNTGFNDVAIRVRSYKYIAGFGVCRYNPPPKLTPLPGHVWPYGKGVLMRLGWTNSRGVLRVQQEINDLGYKPKLVLDGDFGKKTEVGVEWLQKHYHIQVDGVVGPITWGKATA